MSEDLSQMFPAVAPSEKEVVTPFYTVTGLGKELCQAELLENVAQYVYDPLMNRVRETYHKFIIILSQDCDLAQDYKKDESEREMNGVLLYEMQHANSFFEQNKMNSKDRQRVRQNREDRYHFLEDCPRHCDLKGEGIPELVIDFKRYFTAPQSDVYRQCGSLHGALRRTRIETPFKEHLQCRAAFYLQRVSLPDRASKLNDTAANIPSTGATQDAPMPQPQP